MFEQYEDLSERIIEHDDELRNYESKLYRRTKYVNNLIVNTSIFNKVTHPFRLIKTLFERRKLKKLHNSYYEKKNTPLPYYFVEESGEEDDFYSAAEYYKPRAMKDFINKNPIPNGKRLLQTKR